VESLSVTKKDADLNYLQKQQQAKQNGEVPVVSWEKYFYPATEFSVKNYLFSKGVNLEFPDYLLISRNYYEKKWGLTTHRRLKNVIVTMDFVPSKSAVREIAAVGKGFTLEQEESLKRAFGAHTTGGGQISVSELKEVLRAVDVDVDGEDGDKFFQSLPDLKSRVITFDELKHYLTQRMFYRVQAGRYYVALSLFEAECMRATMHQQLGLPLVPGKDVSVALRTERAMLDATHGYEPAQSFQDSTARSCFRFIDSQVNYQPRELTLLLRSLQNNDLERRYNFFVEVRSNRRRKQIDPATTALSKVFITADEHHLLNYKIAAGRITALLKQRGMYPRDAFGAIDRDRDGLLSGEDLKKGMDWLGLKLDPTLVNGFMKELDKDKDGFINLEEFKAAVGFEDDGTMEQNMAAFNGGMPLPPMPSDDGEKRKVVIPEPVLASIKVKVKKVGKFSLVWNSQGSMSRERISIWDPKTEGGSFKQNKASVSLGHFAGSGFDNPNRDSTERLYLEITDTSGSWVGGSSWLPHVLDRFLPHPARFRLAWSLTHGSNPFYAWEPVPPGEEFVALGFVGTKTDKQPPVKSIRCVPLAWCKESTYLKKIWDDSGSAGRAGSVWVFNSLHLIGFVSGSDPPRKRPYDLKAKRFFLKEYSDTRTGGSAAAAAPGNYQSPKF
jgi:Ca2+-binding EF-hand superfamily protein